MKTQQHRTLIIVLGVAIAVCVSLFTLNSKAADKNEAQVNMLSKYKSTVPLITEPLYILVKGLNIVNK
ncbi:hypothetical protein [Fulvivirga lutea]|uniref:Uncharacterized protein n=1 Tax=Fulvivirga lutea TaxID=2810512 RepID=A0A974WH91_9BACT|nr:hypothetical protein [Fulvivirga lutea]QSE98488.1 hypothetical protein JR347_05255 [Fulvivirga lutea]